MRGDSEDDVKLRETALKNVESILAARKDGTLINISLSVSPIKDASGRIIGAAKIARDVTRQRRIEEALTASDRRFRLMADSAPVLIWMSDISKGFTWFNRPWLKFTGRNPDQEMGFGWTENVHLDDLDRCMQIYTTSPAKCSSMYSGSA